MYTIVKEVVTTPKPIVEKVEVPATLEQYVGYQIAEGRKRQGLNLNDLLIKVDHKISISYLKNVEKGLDTFKLRDMELICKALKMDVVSLFPPTPKAITAV